MAASILQTLTVATAVGVTDSASGTISPGLAVCTVPAKDTVTLATTTPLSLGAYLGIALQGYGPAPASVIYQKLGPVDSSIKNLGAGTAGNVGIDANGNMIRWVSGVIVGTCDAYGNITLTLTNAPGAGSSSGFFGDGSDGSVTFDGTTTILSMAPSSSVYTMTRDIQCEDITINTGVTVKTANFKIFATGVITNNGTISNVGVAGAVGTTGGTAGGVAVAAGSLYGGTSGGAGAAGSNAGGAGSNQTASTTWLGVTVGGAGGTDGTNGGGAAGTMTVVPAAYGTTRLPPVALNGIVWNGITAVGVKCGTGGGGGGGDNAGSGGGAGGSAAGVLVIGAQELVNAGTISLAGGNGGAGLVIASHNSGGGGGGSGGVLILITKLYSNTGTVTVAGGTGGVGAGSAAVAGANGGAGVIYQLAA